MQIGVPPDAKPGAVEPIRARGDWLVCRETCIPEGADLALDLPVAARSEPSQSHAAIDAARAALPQPLPPGWTATAAATGAVIELQLTPASARPDAGQLQFFADANDRIEPSFPQTSTAGADAGYRVRLPVSHLLSGDFGRLRGVLVAEKGFIAASGTIKAVALDVPLAGTPLAGPKPLQAAADTDFSGESTDGASTLSLPVAIAFALAGGLLLNLMPCVFPVLSLKAMALAAANVDRRAPRRDGIVFAAGVIIALVALGGAIAAFRAAGQQLGWGSSCNLPRP